MIIIVDGYNLLRSVPPYQKTISDKERRHFIVTLNNYAKLKGNKIILVFDGDSYDRPAKEKIGVVWVVYSGYDMNADDYIKKYIQLHYIKDLLLVSSDRELNNYAATFKVPSIDSEIFYRIIKESKAHHALHAIKNQQYVKIATETSHDVDSIMKNASTIVPEKAEDNEMAHKARASKKHHLDKTERSLLKKVRKL